MRGLLERLLRRRSPDEPAREHLSFDHWPAVVYAIGDIHGCLPQLRELEAMIVDDAAGIAGEKWIVALGDFIDRGPQSAGVLDHLMMPPPLGFTRHCIAGNHETMMLDYWDRPNPKATWLAFGGMDTLASYGISHKAATSASPKAMRDILDSHVPREHYDFLADLPLTLSLPAAVFVHAGIRRGVPIDQQQEADVLWIRDEFFDVPGNDGPLVVHGHTPGTEPLWLNNRICVDTGAFATGRLTAVRLTLQDEPRFLTTEMRP